MKDEDKTEKQPTIETLHKQIEELKKSESKYKEIEKVIKASSDEWRTTFDSIKDAICLLDIERKIIRCNKAMSELLVSHLQSSSAVPAVRLSMAIQNL